MSTVWPLHRFHGGIHPPENKHISTTLPIQQAALPKRLLVPLLQHIGQPALPCVSEGEAVLKGQLIATPVGLGAAVHAPSSGTVQRIGPAPYPHASGQPFAAIEIATDGKDQWHPDIQPADADSLSDEQILQRIHNAGISGMGGAGFPAAIKLQGGRNARIDTLIINGTECEPYITADDLLMRERAADILSGAALMQRLLDARQVVIAVEDNKPEALASMRAALGIRPWTVVAIPTLYPSGGERQLIKILTGQEVPSGRLPADIGIVCQNVGTAAAVHNAVYLGRPLISRITTLTGAALRQPMNVECLVGTSVSELLQQAGLDQRAMNRVIVGGPMMGFSLADLDAPVIKTSNCLIASTQQEMPAPEPALPCIRCGECELACPANLLPQQLLFYAQGGEHEQLQANNLFDCIECGACAYVCSSRIPLVQYYRAAKAEIRDLQQKQAKAEHARQRFEFRQERLRLEEERKAAERIARAERLARTKAAQEKAAAHQPASSADADAEALKKLKIASSMAKVALTKAQKQLALHDTPELHAQVAQLQAAADAALQALTAAENQQPAPAATAATQPAKATVNEAVKKAKVELAMAKAALKKAERAEATEDALAPLRDALSQAELHLANTEAANPPAAVPPAAAAKADKPVLSDAVKKAKIELAMAKAALKKAERAEAAEDQLATLRAALSQAEQALAQAEGTPE
ncbi:MAG: electron transport complex subunit RsxC [Thiopseudomonas sp.]|nr:electron transport complex subunit RsxC [Thiopseudomonas sp.]